MILPEPTYYFGLESSPDGHEKHKVIVAIFREPSFGLQDGMIIIGSLIDIRSLEIWVTLKLSLEEDLAKPHKN